MTPTTSSGADAAGELPDLDDQAVARIEDGLFTRIRQEPRGAAAGRGATATARGATPARTARHRRRNWLVAGGVAAAVVIVAAVIAPGVGSLIRGASTAGSEAADGAWTTTAEDWAVIPQPGVADEDAESGLGIVGGAAGDTGDGVQAREVIATASATLEVGSGARAAADALDAISAEAEAAGGFVESLSLGRAGGLGGGTIDGGSTDGGIIGQYSDAELDPYPSAVSDTWITVRVPSTELTATIERLDEVGEVTASRISRQDVTTEAVDLRARVASAQASVERLTALLNEAGSLSDLIAAEDALAERQAELESLQGQLKYLDSQVSLSSLTVSIVTPAERVDADPAGFTDGLLAGWNGLVAAMNGIVVALGFLLPWLAVIGVIGAVVWLIRRAVRRRRSPAPEAPTER